MQLLMNNLRADGIPTKPIIETRTVGASVANATEVFDFVMSAYID